MEMRFIREGVRIKERRDHGDLGRVERAGDLSSD